MTDLRTLSIRAAITELARVTKTDAMEWNCSTAPVCGIGDEFFYTHKQDPNRFVYICIEDGVVTSCETS